MDDSTKTNTFDHLIVLLDPSSPDGDSGARIGLSLVGREGRLTLAVALNGPESWALDAFAAAEELSIREAARIYLDQVAERLPGGVVTKTAVDGSDLAADLVTLVEDSQADGVVAPALAAARAMATKRSWATLPFPVVVIPPAPAAA